MEAKTNFNVSARELNSMLNEKLSSIYSKGLDLNIKALHYVDSIKRAIVFLQSVNSEYYSQEDLKVFVEMRALANRLINDLETYTLMKDRSFTY